MARQRAAAYSDAELIGAGLALGGSALFGYLVIWPLAQKGLLREGPESGPDVQRLDEALIAYSVSLGAVALVVHQTAELVDSFAKTGELPKELLP